MKSCKFVDINNALDTYQIRVPVVCPSDSLYSHHVGFSYLYDKMLRIIIRKTTFFGLFLLFMDGKCFTVT